MALNCAAVAVGSPKSGTIPARRRRNAHVGNLRRRGNFFFKRRTSSFQKRAPAPPYIYLLRKLTRRVKELSPRRDGVDHALYNKRSSGVQDARVRPQTLTCEKEKKKKRLIAIQRVNRQISPSVGPLRLCARACSRQRHLTMRVQLNQAGALLCLLAGENGRRPNSPLP